ncbi:hypothetical protein Fmac_012485 [Flemingia macrophylla]|uniref:Uncharacterized protein n=1 Tax=Flemingia macrophylla TaxID=520843 RepID=A0ABD1MQE9_9FABA
MANTSCPIELEPRTLNQVQLTQAREVAAEVVQKLEPCEASALFIEGLMNPIQEDDENGTPTDKKLLLDCMKKTDTIPIPDDKSCHCQCACATEDLFKQPLSAPF